MDAELAALLRRVLQIATPPERAVISDRVARASRAALKNLEDLDGCR